jgi:hypothetical protein
MASSLDLPTFIARWQASTGSERSTAQSHFIDLCNVLGQPHPRLLALNAERDSANKTTDSQQHSA